MAIRNWNPESFETELGMVTYEGKFIVIFSDEWHSEEVKESFLSFLKSNFTPREYLALLKIGGYTEGYQPFNILRMKGWKH